MVFLCEEKVIIKYLQINYKFGATRIVIDHPEHKYNKWCEKTVSRIDETSQVA